jgi:hypothetical protein
LLAPTAVGWVIPQRSLHALALRPVQAIGIVEG